MAWSCALTQRFHMLLKPLAPTSAYRPGFISFPQTEGLGVGCKSTSTSLIRRQLHTCVHAERLAPTTSVCQSHKLLQCENHRFSLLGVTVMHRHVLPSQASRIFHSRLFHQPSSGTHRAEVKILTQTDTTSNRRTVVSQKAEELTQDTQSIRLPQTRKFHSSSIFHQFSTAYIVDKVQTGILTTSTSKHPSAHRKIQTQAHTLTTRTNSTENTGEEKHPQNILLPQTRKLHSGLFSQPSNSSSSTSTSTSTTRSTQSGDTNRAFTFSTTNSAVGTEKTGEKTTHPQKIVLPQTRKLHSGLFSQPSSSTRSTSSTSSSSSSTQSGDKTQALPFSTTSAAVGTEKAAARGGGEQLTLDTLFSEANKARVARNLETATPARTLEMMGVKEVKKVSAVLVPLCVVNGLPSILFTLRSSSLRKHRGEVSFPGGNQDETDRDHVHTALRETYEEIGLNPRYFDVWGVLPPTPNRNPKEGRVTYPVIAHYTKDLDLSTLTLNTDEVEEAFTISIRDLCEGGSRGPVGEESAREGVEGVRMGSTQFRTGPGFTMPVVLGAAHRVWGLSAIILHQTLTLVAPGLYTYRLRHVK